MKKILKYLFMLIVLVLGVFLIYTFTTKDQDTDAVRFKEEYEKYNGTKTKSDKVYPQVSIGKKNPVIYADYKKLFEVLEKGTGVIYFGFPQCPWCRNAVPILLDSVSDYDLSIYYMNMLDKRDTLELDENNNVVTVKEATYDYKKLLSILDNYLMDYTLEDKDGNEIYTGEKRVYVPIVIFVKNGEIIVDHTDTVESQTDPYIILTSEQKQELKSIYTSYIDQIFVCDMTEEKGC